MFELRIIVFDYKIKIKYSFPLKNECVVVNKIVFCIFAELFTLPHISVTLSKTSVENNRLKEKNDLVQVIFSFAFKRFNRQI
jgi:hypothetical protein